MTTETTVASPVHPWRSVGTVQPPYTTGKPKPQSLVLILDRDHQYWVVYPGGVKKPVDFKSLRRENWRLQTRDKKTKDCWQNAAFEG